MKKINFFVFLVIGVLSFLLFSCNNEKLPETEREKIAFAFNGVEKSMKEISKQKFSTSSNSNSTLLSYDISDSTINTIFSHMTNYDDGDFTYSYDEPPMIQFQYLKALYEEIGEEFKLNQRYSYNGSGTIHYDFKNRRSEESEDYLVNYQMEFSFILNIDENDLITAEVGFDIKYTPKDGIIRNQIMHAILELDYNMDNLNPTYKLVIYNLDDMLSYPTDEKMMSLEYDFVDVKDNKVIEWRKFGVCAPTSFDNYQDDDFLYKYTVLRGYKDSKKYKIENSYKKDTDLKNAVFNGLGLVNICSFYKEFYKKDSIKNDKIQVIINRFNTIFGSDVINHIVYTGGTEKYEREESHHLSDNAKLQVTFSNKEVNDYLYYEDFIFDTIFKEDCRLLNGHFVIQLVDGDYVAKTYTDLSELKIRVKETSYDTNQFVEVTGDESLSDIAIESGALGNYEKLNFDINIELKDNSKIKLANPIRISLVNEEVFVKILRVWPERLLNEFFNVTNFIPSFKSDYALFPFTTNDSFIITVDRTSAYEFKDYGIDLVEASFDKIDDNNYQKRINENYVLKVEINGTVIKFSKVLEQEPKRTVKNEIEDYFTGLDEDLIPNLDGDYTYRMEGNSIRITGLNNSDLDDYVDSFSSTDFVLFTWNEYHSAIIRDDGKLYIIYAAGKELKLGVVSADITLVGDFNDWNLNSSDYTMDNIVFKNNRLYFSINLGLQKNQSFKLVKNHSWSDGGYGYDRIVPASDQTPEDMENFMYSDSNNIKTVTTGKYAVYVSFDFDINSSQTSFVILEVNIYTISTSQS